MIQVSNRKAKFSMLKPYCYFSKDDEYAEVTEWSNGEGFDVVIKETKHISLTWGEWECVQALVSYKE